MGDATSISWTDATWNPIRGCRRTAPECSKQSGCGDPSGGGCYAERQAARFAGPGGAYEGLITLTANGPRWSGKTRFVRDHLLDPLRWRRPRKIFTDSMSDLFYKGVERSWVDDIVAVMMVACLSEDSAGHIFQTLTKRADEMREYFADPGTQERVARAAGRLMEDGDGWFDMIAFREEGLTHPNMWWGVSVENQPALAARLPHLEEVPAAVRFLSCEPLLGPLDFSAGALQYIHWVIVGCESGHRARRCDPAWLRSVRDQCKAAGVPIFVKQAEESLEHDAGNDWNPNDDGIIDEPIRFGEGSSLKARRPGGLHIIERPYLDDEQHLAFPTVQP